MEQDYLQLGSSFASLTRAGTHVGLQQVFFGRNQLSYVVFIFVLYVYRNLPVEVHRPPVVWAADVPVVHGMHGMVDWIMVSNQWASWLRHPPGQSSQPRKKKREVARHVLPEVLRHRYHSRIMKIGLVIVSPCSSLSSYPKLTDQQFPRVWRLGAFDTWSLPNP